MDVALLYFDDCPNWRRTAAMLDDLAAELAFTWSAVVVDTPEAAQAARFHGSPSIHIDGVDPFADPTTPVSLSCRIYRTPTGIAGSPDRSQLKDALIKGGTRSR
ncbi:MAG: thioredoxin family protein [Candidatus Nanopelagicales bacterium]